MAIKELVTSREVTLSGTAPSAKFTYYISETTSETTALSTLGSNAPTLYQGMVRLTYSVKPIGDPSEHGNWYGTATYGKAPTIGGSQETGTSTTSFSTGGGTTRVTSAKNHIADYPGSTAADYDGAINVSGEGKDQKVEGVDIVTPVYNFSETHYIPYDDVTLAYRGQLFALTGTVNNASFKGTSAGECLFLGASGSVRGENIDWEVTFNFSATPNQTGLTVGEITGIDKEGWQYLWVRYAPKDVDGVTVQKAVSVHVEQVYDYGDFSLMDIGT